MECTPRVFKSFYKKMFLACFLLLAMLLLVVSFGTFYAYFRNSADTLADYSLQNASHSKNNLALQLQDIRQLTDNMFLSAEIHDILSNPQDPSRNQTVLQSYYQKQKVSSPLFICQVDLLDFYSNKYTYYGSAAFAHSYVANDTVREAQWYKDALDAGGMLLWLDGAEISPKAGHLLFAVRAVKNAMENRVLGVAVISFLKRGVSDGLSDYTSEDTTLALADAQGRRILQQGSVADADTPDGAQILNMEKVTGPKGYYQSFTGSTLTVYFFDPQTKWYIVQTTQLTGFFAFLQQMVWPITLLLLTLALAGSFSYWMYRKVSAPIFTLVESMKALEVLDFSIPRLDTRRNDEIGYLNNGYLLMIKELQRLFNSLIKEQTAKKNAEIHALQLQMNPHFLYNTLTVARYLVDMNQKENASQVLISLIKLLKVNLDPQKEILTVQQELEYLRNYVLIQKNRYDNFEVAYDVPPDCMRCLLPRLIIQPLVENSLFHGLKNGELAGRIVIAMRREAQTLCVSVQDNGRGFPPDFDLAHTRVNSERRSVSIGMSNINERLQLRYGAQSGLRLSSQSVGARVEFTIPLSLQEETACTVF